MGWNTLHAVCMEGKTNDIEEEIMQKGNSIAICSTVFTIKILLKHIHKVREIYGWSRDQGETNGQ
jgi:hypothetical protein